jgi:hypothetical protein
LVEVVGRWWNGIWGRLARRDIWLARRTHWQVRARQGDSESGRELLWQFDSEAEARAMVQRLIRAGGPGSWRELPVDRPTHRGGGEHAAGGDEGGGGR